MGRLELLLTENIALDNQLEDYFEVKDTYDDPLMMCLKAEQQPSQTFELVSAFISKNVDYAIEIFRLENDVIFFEILTDFKSIQSFSDRLLSELSTQDLTVQLSVFRHNPLGSLWETLDWSLQLLDEIVANSPTKSAVDYNDFVGQDNWPGIDKYYTDDD